MRTIIAVSLLFYILISNISLASAVNCYNTGHFRANSTYAKNRDLLFSSLVSNVTANGGFYSTTIGQDDDKVYALVLCLSNPSAENCEFCVRSAIEDLKEACPNQTEAISWGGYPVPCIVRYANRPLLGRMLLYPTDFSYKQAKLDTNLTEFNIIWTSLMNKTVAKASMSSSTLKMAAEIADLSPKKNIYVLMQCTPDISQSSCSYCLQNSVTTYNDSSFATQGCYIQTPSCFFRWEVYPFHTVFSESPPGAPHPLVVSPSSPTTTTIRKDNKRNIKVIIIISVVVLGPIAIAICIFCLWKQIVKYRERKGKSKQTSLSVRKESYPRQKMIQGNLNQVKLQELLVFNLEKLIAATDNFDSAKKLGQGGFGSVYKGKLPDGLEIAVKRLSRESKQGQEEFMNEVLVISKLQHRNLVRLLGCCVEGEERMLVYEYMPNKSLDACLFDPQTKQLLNWKKRLNVVEGICRGLLYLHRDSRLKIIHRDLKASNILLDHELNPKISDFGMARIFGSNEDQANTRRVVGTFGYMPPEYAIEGRFSEKSDVFSFGVLLLEILSGRENTSFYGNEEALSLLTFAWKLWNEGNIVALVDPLISNSSFQADVFRCIHVGLLCVQEFAIDRPTISTVISMLNSEIADLPAPKQPAFVDRKSYLDLESYRRRQKIDSVNNVTVTVGGR